MYCPPDYVDQETLQRLSPESWHNEATEIQELINLKAQGSNNSTRAAKEVRNDSKDYFNSEYGKLSWQREIVQSTTSLKKQPSRGVLRKRCSESMQQIHNISIQMTCEDARHPPKKWYRLRMIIRKYW